MAEIIKRGEFSNRPYKFVIAGDEPTVDEQMRIDQILRQREFDFAKQYEQKYEVPITSEGEGVLNYLGEIPKGLVRGGVGLFESGLLGAAAALPEGYETPVREAIRGGAYALKPQADVGLEESVTTKLSEGVGSFLPLVPISMIPVVGGPTAIGIGALAGAGEASERARAAGATVEERGQAAALGLLPGAIDILPIKFMKSLGEPATGTIRNRLARAAATGGTEAAQETAQEIAQNLIEQGVYNPEKGTFEGTGESLGYGFGTGALVQALLDLLPGRTAAAPAAPTATPPATPTPAAPPAAPTVTPTATQEQIDEAMGEVVPPEAYAADAAAAAGVGGVREDPDLIEARGIYEERLALGGTEQDAAKAAVNYVDSLQPDVQARLNRFRSTMARVANPTSERGAMPPDLPDEAYAAEFGPATQKDLFTEEAKAAAEAVPEPTVKLPEAKPATQPPKVEIQGADWLKQNVEFARELADRRGITGKMEDLFAQGLTAGQVRIRLESEGDLKGIEPEEKAGFVASVRASLGIPSQMDTDGKTEFQDWLKGYTSRKDAEAKAAEVKRPAEEQVAQPEVQLETPDVTQIAETEPAGVGVGTDAGEPSVGDGGQPAGDVTPAGELAASQKEGLGRNLPLPVGAPAAEGSQPDTLTQLEEQLAAARAKAAELRKKVPAGVLERTLSGTTVDPALPKKIKNLQNRLNNLRATAEKAREAYQRTKVAGPARDERLAKYEEAVAKVRAAEAELATLNEELTAAELAAGLSRAATPKVAMEGKAKQAYTNYMNALRDADTLRQQVESERARTAGTPPEAPPLPTGLRSDILPELNVVYPRGGAEGLGQPVPSLREPVIPEMSLTMLGQRKVIPPAAATRAVAEAVRRDGLMQRFVASFERLSPPAMVRYTTARGGINNAGSWKYYPDWMPLDDQKRILQLLGRPTREERSKYGLKELPRLTDSEADAQRYFSKTIRPVDAIDLMLADLSVYYKEYKGTPGRTGVGLHEFLLGTGSDFAESALKWVRANLSPATNAEIDLIIAKKAEEDARLENLLESVDHVEVSRAKRLAAKAARLARQKAVEESGYTPTAIVNKMAAGDGRVALQQEMHPAVKTALIAGDLRGALRALAETTNNKELSALANAFADRVGTTRVRVLFPGDPAKYIGMSRGVYVQQPEAGMDPDYENIILINGQIGMTNHVLMHEMAHALTVNLIDTQPNHPTVRQLETLLEELRKAGPSKRRMVYNNRVEFTYPEDFYGLRSVKEMVAEAYGRLAMGETDNGLRDLMKRTRLPLETQTTEEVPLNAWEKFKEITGNIFNFFMRRPFTRYPRRTRTATKYSVETALDRFHRLTDGILSEAPQVASDYAIKQATVDPMAGRNLLNNAVLSADTWTPEGRERMKELASASVPKEFRRAIYSLLQLDWFNDFAGKYFPQIAKLKEIDDQRRGQGERINKQISSVLEDILDYAKGFPEAVKVLFNVMTHASLAQVDPTKPESTYAADKDKLRVWHELNRMLNGVDQSGKARELFKKLRNVNDARRAEIKRVLEVRVKDITDDTVKQKQLLAQLMKKLDEENAIDPYFSLMRKGDFWLEYTAEDTMVEPVAVDVQGRPQRPTARYLQVFESASAMDRFKKQLASETGPGGRPLGWDFKEMAQPMRSFYAGQNYVSPAFAQGALNIISSFERPGGTELEKQKVEDARKAIEEMFLRMTPDHSMMKAFLNRKGTRGFVGDLTPLGVVDDPIEMVNLLAEKQRNLTRQLGNIEHGGKIQALMNSAAETRNKLEQSLTLSLDEKMKVDAYLEEFNRRAIFAKRPHVSELSQAVRGVTFGWTLGGLVAGGFNNLFQLPMVAMTELAGRYGGMGSAYREIRFGMATLANAGKTQKVLSYGADGREVRELRNVDNFGSLLNYFEPDAKGRFVLRTDMKIPPKLRAKLANMDVLAEQLELNGMTSATMTQEMLESETGWLHKINRWGGFFMHNAERFTRQTTAIAAYNLELKNAGPNPSEAAKLAAAKKAIEVTDRVNGTIGAATAPPAAQGPIGSVIFMYKKYGLHMARYIINAAKESFTKIDPSMSPDQIEEARKERAVARYQLSGIFAASAIFAGVQGVPFFSEVMTLLNLFFTDDDEERVEVMVQKFLGEPYYYGAMNYLLGVEIASRISMSGLIFRENKIDKDQSVFYDAIEMFGGPAVGVALNFERGAKLIADGELYRGVEAMSPAAIKSIMKGFRYGTDGAETLRGDEVVPITPVDVGRQFLGYTPEAYARAQERVSGAKRIDEAVREKKRKLLRKYNLAIEDADYPAAREVLREMMEFSRQYPEEAISSDTINRSQRSFRQRSEEMISGVTFNNRGRAENYIGEFDPETTIWQ